MKKTKKILFVLLILIILPIIIKAASLVSTYGETVTKAINYITSGGITT